MFTANNRNYAASRLRTKIIALEPSLLLELDRALSIANFNQKTGLNITRQYAVLANGSDNQDIKRILKAGMLDAMKADAKTIHEMDIFKVR
jgi:hypothetical protein